MSDPRAALTPIPTPASFPLAWEEPAFAHLQWSRDRMHFPEPVTPAMELFFEAHNAGFRHAFALYEMPLEVMMLKRINTYAYGAVMPRPLPHDAMVAMGERAQRNLGAAMMRLAERWDGELLPEVKEHLAFWQGADLGGASLSELAEVARETRRRLVRLWEIHFELMVPTLLAGSLFQDTYADLFGADRAFDAYTLLQGFGNKTTEINSALWHLARNADEDVRATILDHDPDVIAGVLRDSPTGRRFLEDFDAYLQAYGRRSETWELRYPSWIEDPTPVWRMLREHLAAPDADPEAEIARLARQRDAAVAEAQRPSGRLPGPRDRALRGHAARGAGGGRAVGGPRLLHRLRGRAPRAAGPARARSPAGGGGRAGFGRRRHDAHARRGAGGAGQPARGRSARAGRAAPRRDGALRRPRGARVDRLHATRPPAPGSRRARHRPLLRYAARSERRSRTC